MKMKRVNTMLRKDCFMKFFTQLLMGTVILLSAGQVVTAQDPLLATNLADFGSTGTGQLVNATATVGFSWTEQQDSGTTAFSLNTTPVVNGSQAWYVDTYSGDQITITLNFDSPVTQPLFFIDRMDDADLDFGVVPEAEAFIVEQTGGMVESGDDLFTAPSGGDAAIGTIGLSGNYSRVTFTISSPSGRDVIHIAAGAESQMLEPPRLSDLSYAQNSVTLQLTNILVASTTTVQRAENLFSSSWTNVAQFISSSSFTNISDTVETDRTFYRFLQE